MGSIFPSRHASIDYLMVLRGAAVIGVLVGHLFGIGSISIGAVSTKASWNYMPQHEPFESWRTVLEILTPLLGTNFVILFFVQSGYLMGKVFFDGRYDADVGKRQFYWARYLRLAPLLYVNLFICLAFYKFADVNLWMAIGDLLFINNFTGRGLNLVTWSLSHEMQYYLIAPFIFILFRKLVGWKTFAVALALLAVAFAISSLLPPFGFIYAFVAGFIVNLIPKRSTTAMMKRCGLVIGLLLLHLGYNVLSFFHLPGAVPFAVVVSAWLVHLCECRAEEKGPAPLILRCGVFTGYLTYGIYLWHYPIIMTRWNDFAEFSQRVAKDLNWGLWQTMVMFHSLELVFVIVLSYVLAYTTFVLVEARFRPSLYSELSKKK